MKLHAIAIAIARFLRLVRDNLSDRFIRLVLEECTLVGNPTEQVIKAGNDQDPNQGAHEHRP
jgi:hypothetical protein